MRFQICESELPPKMRQFLRDIRCGKVFCAETLKLRHREVSSTLRCLVETAQLNDLPAKLDEETANAMIRRLEVENWTVSSISSQKTLLRHYAYETGEGIDWALASGASDRRPVGLVLRSHHWSKYRALLPIMQEEGISDRIIRLADRWMRHCAKVPRLTLEHALCFKIEPRAFGELSEFITAIDAGNPDTRILQAAQRKRRSRAKGVVHKPPYGDLPEPYLAEIKRICRKPRALGGLSNARIKSIGCAIRRLIRSAEARDLAPELSMETARVFAEDLVAGDLKMISAAGYCDFLACFAKRADYPEELFKALMQTHWALKAAAKGDLRRKEIKMAQVPIDLEMLANTAREILELAPMVDDIRNRRRDYTLAGAMALLCKLPIRSLDLRNGKIGKEFTRDSEGWSVDIATSKTGTQISGRLAPCLTPYLDAVLLMDTDPAFLWQIYDQRLGTALFGNPARDWKCYEREWLRRNMTERTGHSAHIVRTLIYDFCTLDSELDGRVAQALTGHAHETSRKFYELNADRYRRTQALDGLRKVEGLLQV